jgi:hypothetical protein
MLWVIFGLVFLILYKNNMAKKYIGENFTLNKILRAIHQNRIESNLLEFSMKSDGIIVYDVYPFSIRKRELICKKWQDKLGFLRINFWKKLCSKESKLLMPLFLLVRSCGNLRGGSWVF